MPSKSNNRIIQNKQAPASSRKTPAPPPVYRPQPTPRVLQTKKPAASTGVIMRVNKLAPNNPQVVQGHASKKPCPCGGGCKCKSKVSKPNQIVNRPQSGRLTVQRSSSIGNTVQLAAVIGGRRKNPSRAVTPTRMKRMTKRQQVKAFGDEAAVAVGKRRRVCGPDRAPAAPNWQNRLWNGHSRPQWTFAASLILLPGTLCAEPGCGAPAAHLDHIVPFKRHINDNANQSTACDGTCHFLGVSRADAVAWANDLANLRPLCAHHNTAKAAADLADAFNVPYPPDCIGPCPMEGACPGCGADICL